MFGHPPCRMVALLSLCIALTFVAWRTHSRESRDGEVARERIMRAETIPVEIEIVEAGEMPRLHEIHITP